MSGFSVEADPLAILSEGPLIATRRHSKTLRRPLPNDRERPISVIDIGRHCQAALTVLQTGFRAFAAVALLGSRNAHRLSCLNPAYRYHIHAFQCVVYK